MKTRLFSLLPLLSLSAADTAVAADRVWDHGLFAASTHWSHRFNWVGNTAPVAGDRLEFPRGAFVEFYISENDYPNGTMFRNLFIKSGTTFASNQGHFMTGNRIELRPDTDNEGLWVESNDNNISPTPAPTALTFPITIGSDASFLSQGRVELRGSVNLQHHRVTADDRSIHAEWDLSGGLVGTGEFKTIGGKINLYDNSAFTGTFLILTGPVVALEANAFGSGAGITTIDESIYDVRDRLTAEVEEAIGPGPYGPYDSGVFLRPATLGESFLFKCGWLVANRGQAQTLTGTVETVFGTRPFAVGAGDFVNKTTVCILEARDNDLTLTGSVQGDGELLISGTHTVRLAGTAANAQTGRTRVGTTGTLELDKLIGPALAGPVDLAPGGVLRMMRNSQLGGAQDLTVEAGAEVQLDGFTAAVKRLVLRGGDVTGGGTLEVRDGLRTSAVVIASQGYSPDVTANLRLTGTTPEFLIEKEEFSLALTGNISVAPGSAVTTLRLTQLPDGNPGTFFWTGACSSAVQFRADAGTLEYAGSAPGMDVVLAGGSLRGDDAAVRDVTNSGAGTLRAKSGSLSVRNLALASAGAVIRDVSDSASAPVEEIVAGGTVSLGGAVLAVESFGQDSSVLSTARTIIRKTSAGPVSGTFRFPAEINGGASIAEGALYPIDGMQWRVSYAGGDGNEVTLTLVGITPTGQTRQWTGNNAGHDWTLGQNWTGNTVPGPGDSVHFAAATDKLPFNNTVPDTLYQQLRVQADGYTLRGQSLALMGGLEVNFPSGQVDVEHGLSLSGNQAFNARQSARLRLAAAPSARVHLNGFGLSLNTATATAAIDVGAPAAGSDPAAALTGAGSIAKLGPGTLHLFAPSSFTGPFTVHEGKVVLARSLTALGLATSGSATELKKNTGALLELTAPAGTLAEPLTINLGTTLRSHPGSGVMNLTGALHAFGVIEAASGALHLSGPATGALVKTGPAPWQINGGAAFAPSSVNHTAGQLSFQLAAGTNWPGTLSAAANTTVRLLAADQLAGPVTLGADALLDLNGHNETLPALQLQDGDVTTGTGTLTCPLIGTSGLLGSSISGKLAIPAGGLTLDVLNDDPATDLTISAVVSGAALTKTGGGLAVLSGANTFTSAQLNDGAIYFNGTNPAAITLNGGTLGGTGTVGTITSAAGGGMVSVGHGIGILSSGSVVWNAATTCAVDMAGATPGTQHDQLNVTGTVNLGGAALLMFPSTSATGVMTIINNDGADAVTGTFAGLPESTLLAAGGLSFRISYTGGTGNDVTLAVVVSGTGVTKTWSGLGGNNQWPTAANWVGGVAPVAGDNLVFPAGVAVKTANNTFPAGTTFNSIRIADSGYGLTGNPISLNAGIVFDYATNVSSVAMDVTLAGPQTVTVLQGAQGVIIPNTALATAGFPLTAQVDGAAARLTLNLLAGTGALVKTGLGGLTMNVNNWTGPVTLSGGETKTGTLSGFGTGASAIIVSSGADLRFENIASGTFTRGLNLSGKLEFSASPITLSGAISLPAGSRRVVEVTGSTPSLSGVLSGSGGLSKTGPGPLTLSGAAANTFAGGCTVADGTLRLSKSSSQVALPGPVTIGDGAGTDILLYVAANQIANDGTVNLLGSGAQMQCSTFSDSIGALRFTGGSVTGSGTLTVGERLESFAAATTATVDINFVPSVSPFSVSIADGAAAVDLAFAGEWQGAATLDADRDGTGTLSLRSGTMRMLTLHDGTTLVTGLFSATGIALSGGTLGGDGITTDVTTVTGKGGVIAPGTSPAELTVANWTGDADTTLTIEIGGPAPGTQHDVLRVTGTADPRDAVLAPVALAGFSPVPGQTFTVVVNDGPDAIGSEFSRMPQGTRFTFAGATAEISYKGGDGNDVVLTVLSINDTGTLRVWDGGGGDANWMTAENWQDDTAPVPGDSLLFPAGAAQLINSNNFPAGTNFHRITATTPCTLNGNSILLNAGVRREPGTAGNVTWNVPIVLTGPQTFSNLDTLQVNFGAAASVNNGGWTLTTETVFGSTVSFGPLSGTGALVSAGAGTTTLTAIPAMTGPLTVQTNSQLRVSAASLGSISGISVANNAEIQMLGAPAKTLTQPITLRGRIQSSVADHLLTGTVTLPTGATGVLFPTSGSLALSGRIQGTGSLKSSGNGIVKLLGTQANTFTGGLQLEGVALHLGKTAGVTALPGPVTGIFTTVQEVNGTITWLAAHQISDSAAVSRITALNLAGFDETIASLTLRRTTVTTGAGTLTLQGSLTCEAHANVSTLSGRLTFTGTGTHLMDIADSTAAPDFECHAVVTAPAGVVVRKTGTGSATFTGACAMSEFQIAAGQVNWNGTAPGTFLTLDGGTLAGTGTFHQLTSAAAGGILTPGAGPGTLAGNNINLNAATTLQVEINGPAAGTQYDVMAVEDESSLGGAVLDLQFGYSPSPGETFTIIDSAGSGVPDTFSGLPEGTHFTAAGRILRINYAGGSGGDVVLTCVDDPGTTIAGLSIVPGTGPNAGLNEVSIAGGGLPGLTYKVEVSGDLVNWILQTTTATSPTGALNANFTESPGLPRRFYRFVLP